MDVVIALGAVGFGGLVVEGVRIFLFDLNFGSPFFGKFFDFFFEFGEFFALFVHPIVNNDNLADSNYQYKNRGQL